MTRPGETIPIILLTGFLGSGKTTLLGQMLKQPELADTAVVVNEIGTVGLDHHLVQGASESVLVLENGCVCCTARDDLAGVLADLFWDRLYRRIPRFSRVVIETTGIATPGPIAETITSDALLLERFRLQRVVTTVDATQAPRQLAAHREVLEQIMGADLLLLTKPDLTDTAQLVTLEQELRKLNPSARIEQACMGTLAPALFFAPDAQIASILTPSSGTDNHRRHDHDHAAHHHVHDGRIHQITARIDRAPDEAMLMRALSDLARDPAAGLLRIKGILRPADAANALVIQAAGNTLHPPVAMAGAEWGEGPGFLTLIGTEAAFAAARACLDRICPGGWRVLAAGEALRPAGAAERETIRGD